MKLSYQFTIAASLLAISTVVGFACTFPTLAFEPDPTGTTSGASNASSTSGSTTSTTGGSGGGASSSSSGSGGASSSSSSSSASGSASSSGSGTGGAPPCSKPCDCDGDGYTSWMCGGDDCADQDPRAYPGAAFRSDNVDLTPPTSPGTTPFDFNCNKKTESETAPISCSLLGNLCSGTGFISKTACGAIGNLAICVKKGLGLTCDPQDTGNQAYQKCH